MLQWVKTSAIGQEECRRLIGDGAEEFVLPDVLCANNPPAVSGCVFDGGAPLVINHHNHTILIGIFSRTAADCDSPLPNFFVRVFPHVEFIKSVLEM